MVEIAISLDGATRSFKHPVKTPGNSEKRSLFSKRQFAEIPAVEDLTFSVGTGETVALIGPNGSGKSTTIKLMTGILFPQTGEVSVLGLNPMKSRSKLLKRIGCVFGQKSNLWFHLPVLDSFKLVQKIYGIPTIQFERRLADLSRTFLLEDLLNVQVRKLSLGQRMKCEIASCLLHSPDIIFLDEPTIGLDVVAKKLIRSELVRLNETENTTIFLTSHDAVDVDVVAKRTLVLSEGKLLFDGKTSELKEHYVKEKRVAVTAEPSMEEIISEIYSDVDGKRTIGSGSQRRTSGRHDGPQS